MYSDFFEFYEFGGVDTMGTGLAVFLVVYLIMLLLASAYSIFVYILQSLGLYTIANRRGIHHPWLAWLPIANMWILGSVADQYRYVAKGQVKNRRKTLVGLMIVLYIMIFAMMGGLIALLIAGIGSEFNMAVSDSSMAIPAIIFLVSYVAMLVIAVVATVYQYISLYDLFYSCNPNNAVAFLVLGIFFTFLLPYFIFACRKKDLGMPPRRVQVPVAPWQPAATPAQPAWQQPVQQTPVEEPIEEEIPAEDEAPAEEETTVEEEAEPTEEIPNED